MKKIISFLLAVVLLVSAVPMVYAADVDYTNGTAVEYTATGTEAYTVTVPAALAPGASGTVTLSGTWPSDKKISVTADTSVTLTNSISGADAKTLNVTFAGMAYTGDNTQARTYTETISVANITNAIFGTWSGHFYYNVTSKTVAVPGATFSDGVTLSWEELQLAENGQTYAYNASEITDSSIGTYAFDSCDKLTSVTIPDGVTIIGYSAFYYCTKLTSVEIPDSVTIIGQKAFSNCTNLTSVDIPDGVTSINFRAFQNCTNLTSVDIPDSVTIIDDDAFYGCTSLTEINFAGTTAQWNAITLANSWNDAVPATEVICSDGTVALS